MKIEQGKTRDVEYPYQIFREGDWEWRVLKHYQGPEKERQNRYAKVYCAVKAPYTFGDWEYGDAYCRAIPGYLES